MFSIKYVMKQLNTFLILCILTISMASMALAAPLVAIVNPQNGTYNATVVPFDWTSNITLNWSGYSLNGAANITVTTNTTLILGSGTYNIVFCGNDSLGAVNCTIPTYFTVDNPATLSIISPISGTKYSTNLVDFTWTSDEVLDWSGYSLNGAANVTIVTNITFSDLAAGSHTVTLCGNDSSGSGNYSCTTSTWTVAAVAGACANIFDTTSDAFALGSIALIIIAAAAIILILINGFGSGVGTADLKTVVATLIVSGVLLVVGYYVVAISYTSMC